MKNTSQILAILTLALIIQSCNSSNNGEQSGTNADTTSAITAAENPSRPAPGSDSEQAQNIQNARDGKAYLSGFGSNWKIDMSVSGQAGYNVNLNLDDGANILTGPVEISKFEGARSETRKAIYKGNIKGIEVEIQVGRESCNDASGKTHGVSVEIKANGKSYTGCGDFAATAATKEPEPKK